MSSYATQIGSPGEMVRPEPGLARGPFAAPPWFFYAVLLVTVLALVGFFGWARRARRRSTPPSR